METRGKRPVPIDAAHVAARAFSAAGLRAGWTKVWRNGGGAGGDGVTIELFRAGVARRLADLRHDLDRGHYVPGPVRRVDIPKRGGGSRPLDSPCVRDRIVHGALAGVLTPLLDAEFEPGSFGYRPGRGVRQAVDRLGFLRRKGFTHVVDADIERFFERVDHAMLLDRLAQSMHDGPLMQLIAHWLEHSAPGGRGLAQGSPLSPLLANLFLDRLDEALSRDGLAIVRYADDFVVLARSPEGAEAALSRTRRLLAARGLALNEAKTRVTDFDAGFRFLGHAFVRAFAVPAPDGDDPEGWGAAQDIVEALRGVARDDARAAEAALALEEADARRRRARLDPGQRVLYLTSPGRRLTVTGTAFLVREDVAEPREAEDWRDLVSIHVDDVDRIEVADHADVDRAALSMAMATGTEVAFVNGHGETMGRAAGVDEGARAARQLAQAAICCDGALAAAFAARLVEGRLRNQRALLQRLNRNRGVPEVAGAVARLGRLIRRLPHCADIDVLRGLEGRAAALYWPAYGGLLEAAFAFDRRDRRGGQPANILINLTAGLLARDCRAALLRAGLHPGFGVLHATRDNGEAAVWDFMEVLRGPLSEAVVSAAVNQKAVSMAMFEKIPGRPGHRLLGSGWRAMIRAYERAAARAVADPVTGRRRTWRALATDQAIRYAQAMEARDAARFSPVALDY